MTTRSFPLTAIRSPRRAQHNKRRFNWPRPSRKARRRNSQQWEQVSPASTGRRAGNSPGGSGGITGIKRFGGAEGGDFPSRNAGIGFESAERAWDAARKEMIDLGAQHYPAEAKSGGFIPELGVEIHKRGGLYYYDQIARGFQDGALGGGVGFGDSGAVARGHMHWDGQKESDGDGVNARAYTQQFQIIMHGLDLGMGPESIGITASQRGRRCRIGMDTNIEVCR